MTAVGAEAVAQQGRGGAVADAAGDGIVGGQQAGVGDVGAHPVVAEVDGGADLGEQAQIFGPGESAVEFCGREEPEEAGDVGEAFEVGPSVGDAVGGDVEKLVAEGEDAHGHAEDAERGVLRAQEQGVGGVEAMVEEPPVEVELEVGGALGEGEVLPEADIRGEAARGEAAGRVDAVVPELVEELHLLFEPRGGGEDVDIADVPGVGAVEEDLGEWDALKDAKLEAGVGEVAGDGADLTGGAEGFDGVGPGLPVQVFADGGGDAGGAEPVEGFEDEGAEPVVGGDGEELLPIERGRRGGGSGELLDLLDLGLVESRARGQEHELHMAWEIAECQHETAPGER